MTIGRQLGRAQDRLLAAFGRVASERGKMVQTMLVPAHGTAVGYWLQLAIATLLATLGLALDSTAVVIGAMLIAPLMTPLVELAMGLATGSPPLMFRATIRTVGSIIGVVAFATAITWVLPFHQITSELSSRIAPSLLDLAVAAACALAAAYATLRANADMATTAAGTSIGISLVPPLCACGYGLAIGDLDVARGAALLFTANLSGILAIATVVFLLAGFARVDIREQETAFDAVHHKQRTVRAGRAWAAAATKRLGPLARAIPPFVLIAIVFFPLRRAVREIKHRTQIEQAVASVLAADQRRVVQYTLDHHAKGVVLRVVVLGDAHTASALEIALRTRLASLDEPDPKLSVWAVPDAASVTALSRRIDDLPPPMAAVAAPVAPVAPAAPVPGETVRRVSDALATAVRAIWPGTAGQLVDVSIDLDHPDQLCVTHLGPPLGPVALALLATHAGAVVISEDALGDRDAEAGDGTRWLPAALDLIARAGRVPGVVVCVTMPTAPHERRPADDPDHAVRAIVTATAGPRETITAGPRWHVGVTTTACPMPTP